MTTHQTLPRLAIEPSGIIQMAEHIRHETKETFAINAVPGAIALDVELLQQMARDFMLLAEKTLRELNRKRGYGVAT